MSSPANQISPAKDVLFGSYRLRAVAGRGGGSQLLIAEQTQTDGGNSIVALKQLFAQPGDSARTRQVWLERSRPVTRLRHAHIATCHEVGEIDGTLFLSMEYLVGEDLQTVIARTGERGRMPVEIAVHLLQQCLSGLHHANMPHGSLSPWAVMISYDGVAKLLGLGVARPGGETGGARAGTTRDPIAYAAPEQLTGAPGDRASDVFSAGVLLWECLTGRHLFGGGAGTREAVLSGSIERPSSVRPEVPAELDAIALKALDRERSRRYPSALELGRALEGWARRAQRPTAEGIGLWMRGMFGAERATLKRAISQGVDIERSVQRLGELAGLPAASVPSSSSSLAAAPARSEARPARPAALAQSRPLWSTGLHQRPSGERPALAPALSIPDGGPGRPEIHGIATPRDLAAVPVTGEHPSPVHPGSEPSPLEVGPGPAAAGKRLRWMLPLVAVAAVGVLAVVLLAAGKARAPAAPAAAAAPQLGSLRVESVPPGAHILVDGEPSGLVTPALLEGMNAGRSLTIQLNKAGYQPVSQQLQVRPGGPHKLVVTLLEGTGTLHLAGAPSGISIFVDDVAVEVASKLNLPLGLRRIRIELADDVLYAGEVDIQRGEQTVHINGPGGSHPGPRTGAQRSKQ